MRCPICGKDNDKVVDSRNAQGGSIIRRRRKCLECRHKFTTYEAVEQTPLYVVKKDDRREPFQQKKLTDGIVTACKKRPVSMDAIERLARRIEMDIRAAYRAEVLSAKIGELVMNGLKELDDVAYVRFASVYRQFKDIDEFLAEVRNIRREHDQQPAAVSEGELSERRNS